MKIKLPKIYPQFIIKNNKKVAAIVSTQDFEKIQSTIDLLNKNIQKLKKSEKSKK